MTLDALDPPAVPVSCACDDACDEPARAPSPCASLAALGGVVRGERASLLAAARGAGLAADEAFDCVQDALVAYLRWQRGAPPVAPEDLPRLLRAMVRNAAANRRRRARTARSHAADGVDTASVASEAPDAEGRLAAVEARARLGVCLARLDDVQRAVVTLRLLDERPGGDVASELGLRPGHVAVLLHRARAALRACMDAPRQ